MLRHQLIYLFLICGLLLAGCAALPASRPLPPTVTHAPVARTTAPFFAVDPAGQRLAIIRDGLRLMVPGATSDTQLTTAVPSALAWSPDGRQLAAAFPGAGKSLVQLYGADGRKQGETTLSGTIGALAWRSPAELLIASAVITTYSFGTDYQQFLTRWDGSAAPASVRVHNATLRPSTVHQLGTNMARAFTLTVSPLGDAIAFTRLHDPPEFTPYLRIMLRHLDTGSEREIANISLDSAPPLFVGIDDELLVNDKSHTIARYTPWRKDSLPTPHGASGGSLAASPGGRLLLTDGQLFAAQELLTSFPASVTGVFAAQGAQLFMLHNGAVHRLAGLPPDPLDLPTGERLKKLLALRALRSQGLISQEDLLKATAN